ncbi:hypothetical protein [Geodermatophilus sp. URMC 62]|uniref:hypothetical protein n=1 Tax=Geodermatophilus sp. URMC 62 TaxID=3423414 RepID=UPI00406C0C45
MRTALLRLTERDPDHPFLSRLRANGTWERVSRPNLAAHVSNLVSEDPQLTARSAPALGAQLLPHRAEPLQIVVGPEHVAVGASHVLGDGRSMTLLLGKLLTEAVPDLSAVAGRTQTSDVLRLLGGHVARQPQTLITAARARRQARAAIQAERASSPTIPTSCDFRVLYQRVHRGPIDALRRWRDATGTSVSMAALLSSLWFRAVAEHVGDLPDGFWFLVDTRRYGSPAFAEIWGNFAQSVYLRPPSLLDAGDAGRAVRAVLDSTWPLAALTLGGLRAGTPTPSPAVGEGVWCQRAYYLSHVAGSAATREWPWTGSADTAVFLSAATPASSRSVTVQFRELAGTLHITATCTASDPIAATLPLVLTALANPIALVNE